MISGVLELRHNFRSKLLKFRSGWQLCDIVALTVQLPFSVCLSRLSL